METMDIINDETTTKDAGQINGMLVALGKHLLKRAHHTDWLGMEVLARTCRAEGIHLDGKGPTAEHLESALKGYFKANGELYQDGVNAEGYDRRVDWDLLFMARFHRYDPNQRTPGMVALGFHHDLLPATCSD